MPRVSTDPADVVRRLRRSVEKLRLELDQCPACDQGAER